MSDIAIRVENLSKLYHIGRARQRHDTLRDALVAGLRAPLERLRRNGRQPADPAEDTIWALKNVSFEVKRGEVVGIIGRNGAGKSTLLKILSRITEPTEGRAEIHGRVGSLLEVGTGFHPELTGRENIYLNGAILGMKRAEIERKFDEIVAFAEIEKFLDTPVKRYSSGMYVRLAFAVAAHLEPEILLVDEVLAVGDFAFQKKCLGKMGDVAKEGRTVLFVSHNMAAVEHLCPSAVLLHQGRVAAWDRTGDVISAYVDSATQRPDGDLHGITSRSGDGRVRFTRVDVLDSRGQLAAVVRSGDRVSFVLEYEALSDINSSSAVMSLAVYDLLGRSLFLCRSDFRTEDYTFLPAEGYVTCTLPKIPLPPGRFYINLQCEVNGRVQDWVQAARGLDIEAGDFFASGRLPAVGRGDLLVEQQWSEVHRVKEPVCRG